MRHLHLQYRGVATAPLLRLPSPPLLQQPTLIKIAFMFGQETHIKFTPYASGRCFDYVCIVYLPRVVAPGLPVGEDICAWAATLPWAWAGRGTLVLPCTRSTCGHYSLFVALLGSFALPLAALLVVSSVVSIVAVVVAIVTPF